MLFPLAQKTFDNSNSNGNLESFIQIGCNNGHFVCGSKHRLHVFNDKRQVTPRLVTTRYLVGVNFSLKNKRLTSTLASIDGRIEYNITKETIQHPSTTSTISVKKITMSRLGSLFLAPHVF